jgi:tRNA threonylcarbamoyladenosine biosynthesis protein TsaB
MRVLAIDTALAACSAAVLDTAAGAILASESLPMMRGHAEAIMPVIARVMDAAGVDFPTLDRIAVTVGPGSFTGLRVGISAARGLALAAGKPVVGLTTLSAFAAPHVAADSQASVVAVIDARHEQVYMQVFGPGGRTLVAPRIAPLREAARAATAGKARLTGNAAELVRAAWPPSEPPPTVLDQCTAPDIAWVARLGAVAAEGQAPPKPLYLRAPDAQPQHAAQLPRK